MLDVSTTGSRRGIARENHVCWVYEDPVEFHERAVAFLTAGMVAGDRLEYIGFASVDQLYRQLRGVAGFEALVERGELAVRSLADIYGVGEVVDPDGPLKGYAAATDEAIARGYSGFRVVADATDLVRTPAQREAFACYEHLIDRYMLDHAFFAMCGYDARELGSAAVAEIACLHPRVNQCAMAFQWHGTTVADVSLRGEVDLASSDVFDITLERTMPLFRQPRVVVDARGLDFIDHRGMLTLERHAHAAGKAVALLTETPIVHRLAEILNLEAVMPGPPA